MNLTEISWPIYKVGTIRPSDEDGVLFFIINDKYYILDDNSISEDTLAKRRLKLLTSGINLYKLKTAIFFLGDFLKISKPSTWFIDSNGKIFRYKKSRYVKLTCKKITKIIPSTSCTYIEAYGLPGRFISLFSPTIEEKYAGFLVIDKAYVFYGYYRERFEDCRRM